MKIPHKTEDTQGGWKFKCGTGMEVSDYDTGNPKMLPDRVARSGDVSGYKGGEGNTKPNRSTVG